jgi:ABC-type multidrug transport system fused ATPase/permease subunit
VGKCGASKSSLLQALLGEMVHERGAVGLGGRVAFSSQSVWLLNGTLRENVVMESIARAQPVDEQRYARTMDVCALRTDLDGLPGGERTEIGEKGVTLSGGQKARVSLARAVYADADIYLLDDVLSAVDARVGSHIFEQCICGVLAEKTRLLVTHHIACLPSVDRIVMMEEGRITAAGTYEQLVAQGVNFTSLVPEQSLQEEEEKKDNQQMQEEEEEGKHTYDHVNKAVLRESVEELLRRSMPEDIAEDDELSRCELRVAHAHGQEDLHSSNNRNNNDSNHTGQLIEKEVRQTGAVKWSVYTRYLHYCASTPVLVVLVLAGGLYYVCMLAANLWLIRWAHLVDQGEHPSASFSVSVYVGLGVLSAAIVLYRQLHWASSCVRASRHIHKDMLARVIRAPMAFFHQNPHGRIINRFSKDMDKVDTELPDQIYEVARCAAQVVFTLILIVVAVPW